jgi:hypothetical protein
LDIALLDCHRRGEFGKRFQEKFAAPEPVGDDLHLVGRRDLAVQAEDLPTTLWTVLWACRPAHLARGLVRASVIEPDGTVRMGESVPLDVAFGMEVPTNWNSDSRSRVGGVISSISIVRVASLR